MMRRKTPTCIENALVLGLLVWVGLLTACSSASDTEGIEEALEDLLTDSLDFENVETIEGEPPEGDDDPNAAPQIAPELAVPDTLRLGESFTVGLETAFAEPERVTEAVVYVRGAQRHLVVSGTPTLNADLLRLMLAGTLKKKERLKGETFRLRVALKADDGAVGAYRDWNLSVSDDDPVEVEGEAIDIVSLSEEDRFLSGRPQGSADPDAPQITRLAGPEQVLIGDDNGSVQLFTFNLERADALEYILISTPGNDAYKRSDGFTIEPVSAVSARTHATGSLPDIGEDGYRVTVAVSVSELVPEDTRLVVLFALQDSQERTGLYVPWEFRALSEWPDGDEPDGDEPDGDDPDGDDPDGDDPDGDAPDGDVVWQSGTCMQHVAEAVVGGAATNVERANGRLYVSFGRWLRLYSDEGQDSTLLDSILLDGNIADMQALDDRLYVATRMGGYHVDISNPNRFGDRVRVTPSWIGSVKARGERVFFGSELWDISSPAAPSLIHEYGNSVFDICTLDDTFAYCVLYGSAELKSWEWLLPDSLPLGNVPIAELSASEFPDDLEVSGGWVYVALAGAGPLVAVIDARSSTTLTRSATLDDAELYPMKLFVVDNMLYTADLFKGIHATDIGNPAAPGETETVSTGAWANDVLLDTNRVYVADGMEGLVVLERGETVTTQLYRARTIGHAGAVAAADGWALVGQKNQLAAVNVADAGTASPPIFFDLSLLVVDIAIRDGRAYIVTEGHLYALDMTQLEAGTQLLDLSPVSSPRAMALRGDYAYLAGADGLQVIDIADPTTTREREVTQRNLPGKGEDIVVTNRIAYVAATDAGLAILDAADGAAPDAAISVSLSDSANAFAVDLFENSASLLVDDGRMAVFDVSDPDAPGDIAWVQLPVGQGTFSGDLQRAFYNAYVINHWLDLYAVDLRDPANPGDAVPFSVLKNNGASPEKMAIFGDYAYVSTRNNGLEIVRLTCE